MAITDPTSAVVDAIVLIVNADTELRTLFGRNSGLIQAWESFAPSSPVPVVLYDETDFSPLYTNVSRFDVQFSAFAADKATANAAVARVEQLLRAPAFIARGLDVARDPERPYGRSWPGAEPGLSDMALRRADLSLTFLITG